jgi:hypothetical protein
MHDLGFKQCKAENDVWMRPSKDRSCYEYVATYVDDLMIAMKDPKEFCGTLKKRFGFKLKGDGVIDYHLGLNYIREKDGTLSTKPIKYIDKMMATFKECFPEEGTPKKAKSPLDKGDHPEIDTSDLCNADEIKIYLKMVGQVMWLVSLGRFDVLSAIITMSRFRAAPRKGHLNRLKRIYGYIKETRDGGIRIRTEIPDLSAYPENNHDWARSIYGQVKEEIPDDAPERLGKPIKLTTYVDANLYHDMVTGRALTTILHFINKTPFDWYTKRQATAESATFSSEFIAARIAVDQIVDIRLTMRYFGVPILGKTIMFGDNQSVVTNATVPHSQLNKRHQALAYHRVREAVASNMLDFHHIPGENNPADILSKHWGFQQVWPLLKALLFWQGDTSSIGKEVAPLRQLNTLSVQSIGELQDPLHIEQIINMLNPYDTQSSVAHVCNMVHITPNVWKFV